MAKRRKLHRHEARVYRPDDLIFVADAIALLADGDTRKHDTDRTRKARMRQNIAYAVNNCQLVETIKFGKKCYVYGRLAAWARDKWPGKYDDLPAIRDPITGAVTGVLTPLAGGGSGYGIPVTLPECRAALVQAEERALALEQKLQLAHEEVDRLRPDAEKWQQQSAQNRLNALQPRPRGKELP